MESYQVGTTQYLQVIVQNEEGDAVHGATVHAQLYRNSDSYYLDTTTNTFVNTGGNKNILLSELSDTGLYRAPFDQTLDNGGVDRNYTAVYIISDPYDATNFDTLSYYDKTLDEIKGDGWQNATTKPDLMSMANKDNNSTFSSNTDSLEALQEQGGPGGVGSGGAENYNTEGL